MRKLQDPGRGFPLVLAGIAVAGLLSALVDGTVGWENLAHTVLKHALQ
jgi:hypothetical protein